MGKTLAGLAYLVWLAIVIGFSAWLAGGVAHTLLDLVLMGWDAGGWN